MLLSDDDFPLHQNPEPIAHSMGGNPNAYDRFWFNGYGEDFFFAVALGLYPNRGVIDGAMAVARPGHQRSVFAGDLLEGRPTSVGPIRVEIVEPLRVNRIVVDAPAQGIAADLTYTAAFSAVEEPRLTIRDGAGTFADYSRASQLGRWTGTIETPEGRLSLDGALGTKDRSWGVRPVGEAVPGAPRPRPPQACFFWAPLHVGDRGFHYSSLEDHDGVPYGRSAFVVGPGGAVREAITSSLAVVGQPGTRWPASAVLSVDDERIELTPILRFQMRGAGYLHPTYGHGRYHGGPYVDGEILDLSATDPLDVFNIHVQHVVRATAGREVGWGVLESLAIGPQSRLGLTGLLDGF